MSWLWWITGPIVLLVGVGGIGAIVTSIVDEVKRKKKREANLQLLRRGLGIVDDDGSKLRRPEGHPSVWIEGKGNWPLSQ